MIAPYYCNVNSYNYIFLYKPQNSDINQLAIYAEWKKSGYDKHFYVQHEQEIIIHKAAKKALDAVPGKFPTIKELSTGYSEVLAKRQAAYAQYRETRDSIPTRQGHEVMTVILGLTFFPRITTRKKRIALFLLLIVWGLSLPS
jgi:hypothetical protein